MKSATRTSSFSTARWWTTSISSDEGSRRLPPIGSRRRFRPLDADRTCGVSLVCPTICDGNGRHAGAAGMRIVSLLFHDVYVRRPDESGFVSTAADRYKLSVDEFDRQLDGIAAARA